MTDIRALRRHALEAVNLALMATPHEAPVGAELRIAKRRIRDCDYLPSELIFEALIIVLMEVVAHAREEGHKLSAYAIEDATNQLKITMAQSAKVAA